MNRTEITKNAEVFRIKKCLAFEDKLKLALKIPLSMRNHVVSLIKAGASYKEINLLCMTLPRETQ